VFHRLGLGRKADRITRKRSRKETVQWKIVELDWRHSLDGEKQATASSCLVELFVSRFKRPTLIDSSGCGRNSVTSVITWLPGTELHDTKQTQNLLFVVATAAFAVKTARHKSGINHAIDR